MRPFARANWIIGASLLALCLTAHKAEGQPEPTWPGLETVAQLGPNLSGVVVARGGRIFLSFPRHADDHSSATLVEYRSGLLAPFPNASWSLPGEPDAAKRFVSVEGITLDASGELWVLDSGKQAGKPMEKGGAKLVGIDISRSDVTVKVPLRDEVVLPNSHLSEIRVDRTHGVFGTAFVSDASFGADAALIVVDLATGQSRRLFAHSRFVDPDPRFMSYVENTPHTYDAERASMPQGGINGLELSADSKRLYWTALSGRELFSAPTAVLANFKATPEELEQAVRDEGQRPTSDGLAKDAQGRLYFGAFDQRSIIRRNLDGTFTVVERDTRLAWPDSLFIANDYMYVTLSQLHRSASFNGGKDQRQPPFLLVRFRLR